MTYVDRSSEPRLERILSEMRPRHAGPRCALTHVNCGWVGEGRPRGHFAAHIAAN